MNRRPKVRDEKVHDADDRPPSKALAPAFRVVDPPSPASSSPYRNLRSLPGYSLGDPLRPDDAALLCDSEEATVAVVNRLRPTDCAFVLRSDGAFTYALYEGPWSEDEGRGASREPCEAAALLFRLSDDGNFKVVVRDELLGGRIKIPVLPGQGQDGGRRAPRRSSVKCHPTFESSTPSRRRYSSYALAGPRMDAVLEVREWASRQDDESEASVLRGSSNKSPRRSSTRTEDPRPADPNPTEATVQVQGTKAPRRSSTKCHPTVEPSRPSRRRFSYAPGGQQRPPQRTGGDLRPIRSLPKLSSTAAATAASAGRQHRSFFVGDLFPTERVPVVNRSDNAVAVSRLEIGDAAFVKRSCGKSYSYSAVISKDERSITFRVTDEGNTKTFPLSKAGKFVIVGDVAKAGAGGAREEGSSDDGDATCGDETRGGSTIGALPSAPPPAGELFASPSYLSYLPKRKGGTAPACPPGKNASQRRDSKFSSSTSVTSLCSMASMDDDDEDGGGMFHESERAVIGNDPAVDAARKGDPSPQGPPRGPSPTTGSPKKKKPEHHRAGTKVLYKGPSGVLVEARILAAHHDDEMEPYYTIELSCGREKQTDEAHLVAATAP